MKRDPLEAFLRDLERLHQAHRMYPAGHGQITGAAELAARSLKAWGRPVRMSLVGEDLVVEDKSVHDLGDRLKILASILKANAWEGVRVAPTCQPSDLLEWVTWAQGGLRGTFSGRGIVAGRLNLQSPGAPGGEGSGEWPEGYRAYLPDANEALEELGKVQPAGLDLARQIIRSISGRLASDESLLAAVRALKNFDEYTFTHALNVSILAMALGRELGLPGDLCEIIGLAGLCHDVGKTKIPPEIINKPGKLTNEERGIMNRHPLEGAQTLLALPTQIHPLLPTIAYQHHMGADLGGYPRSPNGRLPHPLSLLVQVADVFDALRTVRAYRGTLTETEAVNILLGDLHGGRIHDASVSALVGVLGLLVPGASVRLADGVQATVVGGLEKDRLVALVETAEGDILDLSDPALPQIASFVEQAET